ncbi:MAG: histidine phosphatase family protein [Bryobacteraceae bacterium]|nr:histidine phosphatase family protein [Bryobacteraceae bacterium]
MELYILRHGIAEDGGPGRPDEKRELTQEGRQKLTGTLRTAARAGIKPAMILTSPLVRAVETAELAATELGYSGDLIRSNALIPEAEPQAVWDEIRTHQNESSLMLSSHNPLCSRLAGYLLAAPELSVEFKKGSMLCVHLDRVGSQPRGVLLWMLGSKFRV